MFLKQKTEGGFSWSNSICEQDCLKRRGQVRVIRIEANQTQRWMYHQMMEASHGQPPPFYLKWDPKPQKAQSALLPAVWKLSPDTNATHFCISTKEKMEYWLQKSWEPPQLFFSGGNKAHIACTFPLDLTASYEPVWGIWDEHDSDLQWAAGAALFMCAQNKVSWAGLAAQPQGSDARMYILQGPKHTHLAHMLCIIRRWICFRRRGNKHLTTEAHFNPGCPWPIGKSWQMMMGCDHKSSCGDLGDSNTP